MHRYHCWPQRSSIRWTKNLLLKKTATDSHMLSRDYSQTWRAWSAVRISAESNHPPIMIASLLMSSHKSESGTALFVKSYCPNSWSFFRVPSAHHDRCETFVRSVPRSQTRWLVLHLYNNLCSASLTTLLYSNLLSFGSCEYLTLSKNPRHGLSDSADESCRLGLMLSVNMMQSPKCLHCWAREMVARLIFTRYVNEPVKPLLAFP